MIHRWTLWVFLFPDLFLDPEAVEEVDIGKWSKEYEWEQDEWNGLKDLAQPVERTLDTMRGDCEDYALVAASVLLRDGHDVTLGFCTMTYYGIPIPRHVVAYDGDVIYSSGTLLAYNDRSAYIEEFGFDGAIWRDV